MSDVKRYDDQEVWKTLYFAGSTEGWVQWQDYARLKAEVERLKAVSTIEQRTIQGLQQTPEWSEIARLTAYCRELEDKVKHLDLFKSVVEKFFNSASLKNPLDTQSYYALAENLKQLPDSILDFTEEQVRDNPAWALAVFRHKVKEMQYKRIHDLNEIGGEQEENAHLHSQFANSEQENKTLKAEVERLNSLCDNLGMGGKHTIMAIMEDNARLKAELDRLADENARLTMMKDACKRMIKRRDKWILEKRAEVERLRKAGDAMADEIIGCYNAEGYDPADSETLPKWNAAKEGKPSV